MAQPTPYNRQASFTTIQQEAPTNPLPGPTVDAELNAIKQTLDELLNNVALIQRDDGQLANESVGPDQLAPSLNLGFDAPTEWATATSYGENATVFVNQKFYVCEESHVSGTFSTDLADGKWRLIADFTIIGDLFKATSETTQTVEVGTKSFVTQGGKYFNVNDGIILYADSSNYVAGRVASYSGTNLTVDVTVAVGSGSFSAWDIRLAWSVEHIEAAANSATAAAASEAAAAASASAASTSAATAATSATDAAGAATTAESSASDAAASAAAAATAETNAETAEANAETAEANAETAQAAAEAARDTIETFIEEASSPISAASESWVSQSAGTNIGNMTANGGLAAAYDSTRAQSAAASAAAGMGTNAYIGKQLAASKIISRVRVFGSNNNGFISGGALSSVTINLYASNSSPANSTDGTLIGTLTFTNTTDESAGRDVYSNDLTNAWAYVWVQLGTIGARVAELEIWEHVATAATIKRPYVRRAREAHDIRDFADVRIDGLTDETTAVNAALVAANAAGIHELRMPPGTYRFDSAILPKDNIFLNARGALLKQYGNFLFQQTAGVGLTRFGLRGAKMQYAGTTPGVGNAAALNCAFALDAHRNCIFDDLYFTGYNNVGIIRRIATGSPGMNTVFNKYRDWYVEDCLWFDYAQGLDTHYTQGLGDGVTTAFATTFNFTKMGDIAVGVWGRDGTPSKKTLITDFTVTGGAGSTGTITFGSAPAAGDIVMIWLKTASNRTSPISGNVWDSPIVRHVDKFFHLAARYVDSEIFIRPWMSLETDAGRGFWCNPFSNGNAECDLMTAIAPTVTYGSGTGAAKWVDFGPGCENMRIDDINVDGTWTAPVSVTDKEEVTLSGTVTATNGSPTVTGASTLFTRELTLDGSVADRIKIDGTEYAIASIASNSSLTLSSNFSGSTGAGKTATAVNKTYKVSYDISTKKDGTAGQRHGRYRRKSGSYVSDVATILDTTTSVAFTLTGFQRAPTLDEIHLSCNLNRTLWVTGISSTGFTINSSSAPPAGQTISVGVKVELEEF